MLVFVLCCVCAVLCCAVLCLCCNVFALCCVDARVYAVLCEMDVCFPPQERERTKSPIYYPINYLYFFFDLIPFLFLFFLSQTCFLSAFRGNEDITSEFLIFCIFYLVIVSYRIISYLIASIHNLPSESY